MKVTLNGNPQNTVLVTYAPTNVADEEETDKSEDEGSSDVAVVADVGAIIERGS